MKTKDKIAMLLVAVIMSANLGQAQYICNYTAAVPAGSWVSAGCDPPLFECWSRSAPGCTVTSDCYNCDGNGTIATYETWDLLEGYQYGNFVENFESDLCAFGTGCS